jgi:mRNA interferase MazF
MARAVVGRWGKNSRSVFPPTSPRRRASVTDNEWKSCRRRTPSSSARSRRKRLRNQCSPASRRRHGALCTAARTIGARIGGVSASRNECARMGCRSRRSYFWLDFDPTIGREQVGRRPALVISPAAFHRNTGFILVCPITTRIRPFPTSVVLPDGLPIAGEILLSHFRSIDALARSIRPVGAAIPRETARLVRAKLAALITI